ncbi:MAG: hypothetical protein A2033_18260 [Bacteroidetes bacterium GWA2_31_9]|nr:MAG: hypothetical protein A2033_18260 [Bacteroidetes bacterium GWA2_31_9]
MDFGKSRVQYENNYWQYFRFQKFDTYFYVGGKELAAYTGEFASTKIPEMESFFDYKLDARIIFIIYNKLSDFRQSNFGLASGNNEYNIGGVTKIIDNKVFLYFEGDFKKFEKQISAAVAEVLLTQMIYGTDFKNKLANSTLMSLPDWFVKGLISYASENWSVEIENKVKDGILSGRYEKFNHLTGEDALYAGHSIWNYIANNYGKSVIPNILYLTRINKNVENGFLYVLGTTLKYLSFDWLNYYDSMYYESQKQQFSYDSGLLKKVKKSRVYSQAKISPDNKTIAYVTNEYGKYKLFLYNTESGKRKKILRREHKLDQITDYSYPIIAWHPRGEVLSAIIESKGELKLMSYSISDERFETKFMPYFEKILDFSYSDDGLKMVFSAVQNGKTDIFVYNVPSNTNEQITNDYFDDFNPRFIDNSKSIIFSSNRLSDTLSVLKKFEKKSDTYDLFIYDYANKNNSLTRLTNTPYDNETQAFESKHHSFIALNDQNGIFNQHLIKFDSTISFIDTSMHYRYFSVDKPLTNNSRNYLEINKGFKGNKNLNLTFNSGKYFINDDKNLSDQTLENYSLTEYKKKYIKQLKLIDSLSNPIIMSKVEDVKKDSIKSLKNDTSKVIDINNYIFNKEKSNAEEAKLKKDTTQISDTTVTGFILPKQMVYFTSFYTNYFVNQIDFGFLSSSYQAYTGGAVYFNPGFNLFMKIGTTDLFEDYKITGGFRFAGNFNSNEYLLSFENLKKRLDKQIILHRQAFSNLSSNSVSKTHTHELMYLLKYPFSQITSVKATLVGRYDRVAFLSSDIPSLYRKNEYKTWAGVKLEYIYDNTRNLGINLYTGTRFKLFGEYYKQVNAKKSELIVLGCDYRHYEKISRTLIWASRFASSASFGSSRLIYYLGGVDNWINLSPKKPMFDNSILINQNQNYSYQAVATNMRGFTQNVRNGTNFALLNNELRFPVIKYFLNRPINSDFLANLQLISFFDVGSAWSGWTPDSPENAYNEEIIRNNPITVIIDKDRTPLVYGYGFGIRSKLLGYFIRCDWAWGIDSYVVSPRIFYLSLSLDF